nr:VWA domain-containing protein [Granulicella sp. dw_53]
MHHLFGHNSSPAAQQPAQQPVQKPAQQQPLVAAAAPQQLPQGPSAPAPASPSALTQTTTPGPQSTPAPTQQQSPANDEPITTIKVQANEVNLIFTVTDKKGRFVPNLRQDSFGLLDDGRPPVRVIHYTLARNLPLRVGIMLDTSSSIRQRFQFEQDSAVEFFLQVLHLNDRAFIEGFDIQTDVAQGFTNNVDLLNQGIRKLRPGGGTALYDALYKTCHEQMLTLRDEVAVRRALVLVSDGDDNYSRALQSDAIKECQRAETTVYSISTNISPSKDKGDEVLKAISAATGGQAFFPVKLEDVATAFHNVEEELRSQYSLIYTPAEFKNDGSFRTIYLQARDPRYHVRAKMGYFSPRPLQ